MRSRLVNVRLDERRLERARRLRARGIPLSKLVRDAIDREYEQVVQARKHLDAELIMRQIYERYPDPPDMPRRTYDVHNRQEARKAIVRKLRRERG